MDAGVFKWGKLSRSFSRRELRAKIREGVLVELRRGWYATPFAHPDVRIAVAAGGVLTCLSALALYGVWVPEGTRIHIRGDEHSSRGHPDWCRQFGRQPGVLEAVDEFLTALRHAARCLSVEDFVVVCDSIVNRGLMRLDDLVAEFADRPRSFQKVLDLIDGRAESGIETMVRLRLIEAGVAVTPQVTIPFVGRVDLLVGTSLIIEVDGARYHFDRANYENDRLRDLHATAFGYRTIRLTYDQVVFQWDVVGPLITRQSCQAAPHRPSDGAPRGRSPP